MMNAIRGWMTFCRGGCGVRFPSDLFLMRFFFCLSEGPRCFWGENERKDGWQQKKSGAADGRRQPLQKHCWRACWTGGGSAWSYARIYDLQRRMARMHTQPQNADRYRNIWLSIRGHGEGFCSCTGTTATEIRPKCGQNVCRIKVLST